MDSKKARALRKKYWTGKTSQKEEEELKKMAEYVSDISDPEELYFRYLNKKEADNPLTHEFDQNILTLINQGRERSTVIKIAIKYWYIAASLALIISAGIIFKNEIFKDHISGQVVTVDTYEDPELAFEETKKALLLISTRLNQSSEYTAQFSKFEQSQEILKQN